MKKFFIFIIIGIFYITMSEMTAKKKAADFCDSIGAKESMVEIANKAGEAGARSKDIYERFSGNMQQLNIPFTGFYRGSDFICRITFENGTIVDKNPNIGTSLL
jgi:hypothetical protein